MPTRCVHRSNASEPWDSQYMEATARANTSVVSFRLNLAIKNEQMNAHSSTCNRNSVSQPAKERPFSARFPQPRGYQFFFGMHIAMYAARMQEHSRELAYMETNRAKRDPSLSPKSLAHHKAPRQNVQDQQDKQDDQQQAQNATWPVTPTRTISPTWQCPQKQKDQDDQQYQTHGSPLSCPRFDSSIAANATAVQESASL